MTCPQDSCPRWSGGSCRADPAKGTAGPGPGREAMAPERSLVLSSLEIGRLLADSDRQAFRARGTCMYPDIRPGDLLRIGSRPAAQVSVGEIAVCRRPDFLFAHRVIGRGIRDGRAYVLTRADKAPGGDDGPTFDDDLLGIVMGIERGGRRISAEKKKYSRPVRILLSVRLGIIESGGLAMFRGRRWIGRLQSTSFYASIGRLFLPAIRRRMSFFVRIPRKIIGDSLYQTIPLDQTDRTGRSDLGLMDERWILAAHFGKAGRAAAWGRFERCPVESGLPQWRLAEMFVRQRYRGTGIEKVLLRRAAAVAGERGMTVRVPED